jgi:hypothetical protein
VITGPAVVATLAEGSTLSENQNVVIQFNRLLNPGTVNRQTITLLTAGGELFVDPNVIYDPVLLTVTLAYPDGGATWLTAGQTYQVQIPAATPTTEGVLAIDNATVATSMQLEFNVVAGDGGLPPPPPPMNFCVDVLPIFLSKCTGAACHSAPGPGPLAPFLPDGGSSPDANVITGAAGGLVLTSSNGVLDTAIDKVAYESNVGPMAGPSSGSCSTTNTETCLFGVDMPVIDPGTAGSGNPGNSWLMYKVLLAVPSPTDEVQPKECAPDITTELYPKGTEPPVEISAAERARLSDYIEGREMPYPSDPAVPEGSDAGTAPLSMQELERVRLWIYEGAPVENCALCAMISSDGGTTEMNDASSPTMDATTGGPSDAGTSG